MQPTDVHQAMLEGCYCHIHDRAEPWVEGAYKACLECGHMWVTRAHFRRDLAEAEGVGEDQLPDGYVDETFCCPLCAHDF